MLLATVEGAGSGVYGEELFCQSCGICKTFCVVIDTNSYGLSWIQEQQLQMREPHQQFR